MPTQSIDLASKLTQFNEYWAPRTVTQFNGHDVMVAKMQGEYSWHSHPDTDDFFLVLHGRIYIDLEEAHILLMEVSGTPNSGDPATAAPRREI